MSSYPTVTCPKTLTSQLNCSVNSTKAFYVLAWITAPDYYFNIVYTGKTSVKLVIIQLFEKTKQTKTKNKKKKKKRYCNRDENCSETFF